MKNHPIFRIAIAVAGALATSVLPQANASDVQSYILTKGQHFGQTNASTTVLLSAEKPFTFYSSVEPTAPDAVTNAYFRTPGVAAARGMSNLLELFEFERSFANKAQLDAAFPVGQYRFIIDTASEGRQRAGLNLPNPGYPVVPRMLYFTDLQEIEADQPLNLSWAPFTGGTTNDFVLLEISDETGESLFSTPGLLESEVLNGATKSVTIPENTLAFEQDYIGRLLFVKRSMLNTNEIPGAVGFSGYYRETRFPLSTLETPPAAGRIQFSASAYRAGEADGTTAITVTRSGSEGQASVNFSTSNGTATDGNDYVGGSTVLTFEDGVTSTTAIINLIDDTALEKNENLQLSLSAPTGGAVLGNRTNATLVLVDNEIASAGTIQFSAPRYVFTEAGRLATLVVNRTGGSKGVVTAEFTTIESTATGTDFTATNGFVRFGPGIVSKKILIPIRDDKQDELNERFSVVLSNPTGGASLGANASANVVITDDDTAGSLSLSAASYKVRENAATVTVTVNRTGGAAGGATVDYTTIDDSAVAGSDFVATSGTLFFGASQMSKTFTIPVLQDFLAEGNERGFIRLSNPNGGALLGKITNASLVILDDESSVAFGKAEYSFSETNRFLVIPVLRSGDLKTPVSVSFATANGTAIAGSDYIATNGVLNFPVDVTTRKIAIPVKRDHEIEDDETLSVSLLNPQGGVQLGVISNANITLTNDDLPGRIVFSAPTYSVAEGTAASIVVQRKGGVSSGVTVSLQTVAGTAIAGTDYTTVSTNITFAGGEASKTIRIPTTKDVTPESNETVTLQLRNPTGGATLGNVSNAVLTIINKADPNAVPAAGESFMNVTITGLNGNPVSKSLNIVNNPLAQETIAAAYTKSLNRIQALTGSKTTVVLNGFTPTTTFHVLQLPFLTAPGPGIYPINPQSTAGGAVWTFTTFGGESHAYGTGRTGSSGSVTIDVLNPTSKIITGRFDFVAVKDGGTQKVRIKGSFRVKNVSVN